MLNITWTIENCEHVVATGFITTAAWRCTGVDGDYSATGYGFCSWSDGEAQIPYADVTEQEVLDWCWASGVDKDAIEANITAQIDLQKNPVQQPGLPWSN